MRILVAGATGRVGGAAVRLLLDAGHEARAMARSEAKADVLRDLGAEAVVGDVRNPDSLAVAVAGCDGVFSALAGGPGRGSHDEVEHRGNLALLAAARRAGATRFVHNSALKVDHPLAESAGAFRSKRDFERALMEYGDVRATVLRPAMFMETLLIALRSNTAFLMGRQPEPVSWIAASDVARAAVASFDRDITGTHELAGPDTATFDSAYEVLGRARGVDIRVVHLPLGGMRAAGRLAPPLRELSGMFALFEDAGYEGDPAPLREVFGSEALTIEQWATQRAAPG